MCKTVDANLVYRGEEALYSGSTIVGVFLTSGMSLYNGSIVTGECLILGTSPSVSVSVYKSG